MTAFTSWLSPDLLRLLALALLHFLWQGLALAALAYFAVALFRSASVRYLLGVSALALMFAAPAVTFFVLQKQQSASPAPEAAAVITAPSHKAFATAPAVAPQQKPMPVPADSLIWLVQVWFAGVFLFSLRPAGGLLILERLRRKEAVPVAENLRATCFALQERLGICRVIRYCECLHLQAPAVVGWFRPVILLPVTGLTGLSELQLRAVVAHELAHIKRLDCFVNLFQIAAETLLFYHPAVWWLSNRIRAERENCCDDAAMAVCGNAIEYARALTLLAERRAAPALAMAANRSPLAARVARLLGLASLGAGVRSAGLAASVLCLSTALLAGNAFFGAAQSQSSSQSPSPDPVILVTAPRPDKPKRPAPSALPAPSPNASEPDAAQAPQASPPPKSSPSPQEKPAPAAKESYIDGLKAAGIENPSIEQLIALKVQGVTPDYVRGMHALGIKPEVNQLIGLKVQGVTPDYVRELRAAGLTLDIEQIIGLKVQGVTPEYVRQLHDLGVKTDTGEIIGMKVQGVTPEYIRDMRAAGLDVKDREIIAMKVQGVTPEYVRKLHDLGLHPGIGEVVGMKVQGITPEYVKALQASGFKLDVGDFIAAKVQGITPEFIENARSHGFKDLDMHKLIALKNAGVLE